MASATTLKVTAPVRTFTLNGHTRSYVDLSMSFADYRKFFKPNAFDALRGSGEQRALKPTHAKKIAKAMLTGDYTPSHRGACLSAKQRKELLTIKDGVATLELREASPIPETDGQHRDEAGLHIRTSNPNLADEVDALPVEVKVMLDGNAKKDFLNHQAGLSVDKAHMFSLKVKLDASPEMEFAWGVAKLLVSRQDGPFNNVIRFDSRGGSGLPVTTLCAKGTSDLSSSLVGLAKVCIEGKQGQEFASNCVVEVYKILKERLASAFEPGKVLTPPPNETRGSATMLVGVSICLAYELIRTESVIPGDELGEKLAKAVSMSLDRALSVDVKLSAQGKRTLLNEFCSYFFDGLDGNRSGVPNALMNTLSTSAYGVAKS